MKKEHQFGSIRELTEGNFTTEKVFLFRLLKKSNISSYASDEMGQKRLLANPATRAVKMEFPAIDKDGKRRLVRHVGGEDSIFKDKQSPDTDIPKAVTTIKFINGILSLKGDEKTLLEAMACDDRNASKIGRNTNVKAIYYLYDRSSVLDSIIENDNKLTDAKWWINNPENIDAVMAYGRVMLPKYNTMDFKEVKYKLGQLATGNLDLFLSGIKNPATLKKHYILEAIEMGFLKYVESQNSLYYKDGMLLLTAPVGVSPVDLFVDNTMNDASGRWSKVYSDILIKIGKGENPKPKKVEKIEVEDNSNSSQNETLTTSGLTQVEAEELLNKAILAKVIDHKKPTHYKFMKDVPKETRGFVGKIGAKGIVTALMEEPDFCNKIQTMVGI